MIKSCICLLCICWMGVQITFGNEVKPLQLKVGEKYELRAMQTVLSRDADKKRPDLRKTITKEYYDFSVLKADRKKGFLLEMRRRQHHQIGLKKKPDQSCWKETSLFHSNIVSSLRGGDRSVFYPAIDSSFLVRLSPTYQVVSVDGANLLEEEDRKEVATQLQGWFSAGRKAIYSLTDTLIRVEYPEGRLFLDDWETKIYRLVSEIQDEVRFSQVNVLPFSVVLEGVKDEYVEWGETNTTVRGKVQGKDSVIRIVCSQNYPFYEKRVYRVPIIKGQFEFRLNLSEPLVACGLGDKHSLFLEPGDDLTVTMDSVNADKIEFSGLGAGNNRYYDQWHGWGFSLYRIDYEKMSTKEYYAKLEEKADYFRQRMEEKKVGLTPALYQYMLDCFKYRPVYQKLIAPVDSTVGVFDRLEGFELCNPLAVNCDEYRSVLRHVVMMEAPKKLAEFGSGLPAWGPLERRKIAEILLDGEVLEMFLTQWVVETLGRDFGEGKELYDYYKTCYSESPHMNLLEEYYRKAALLAPGSAAPDFVLQDISGDSVSLSSFRGKVVYIDFWSLGCGPCMYEFKYEAPKLKEYFKDREVVFLNVITHCDNPAWKKLVEDFQIKGVNLKDTPVNSVGKSYMVRGYPRYVLIGKDGKLIDLDAPRPSEGENIKKMIEKALE